MKQIITFSFVLLTFWSFGQSNLTVFNNDGRQFYVIMNGIKQNAVPQTNVYISNVKNGVYSVKLIFADGITADIDKNVYFDEPSDVVTRVKFKKGKGTLQLISILPTNGPLQDPSTVVYRSSNSSNYTDAPQQTAVTQPNPPIQQQAAVPAQTTTVTTTTTSQVNTSTSAVPVTNQTNSNAGMNMNVNVTDPTMSNGQVGMNMNVNVTDPTMSNGQAGMNMNVNVTDPTMSNGQVGMNMNVNVTDPTISNGQVGMNMNVNVTDPSISNGQAGMNMNVNVNDPMLTNNGSVNMNVGSSMNQSSSSFQTSQTTITTTTTTSTNQTVTPPPVQQVQQVPVQSVQTTPGCRNILGDGDQFVADLKDLSFDSDRKEAIIGDLATYCLTASQAYKIIETLNYDSDRLEASKFLFERMIDKDKGNVLLPLLTFDSSKMEYREHMRKFR